MKWSQILKLFLSVAEASGIHNGHGLKLEFTMLIFFVAKTAGNVLQNYDFFVEIEERLKIIIIIMF